MADKDKITDEEALRYHSEGQPGKLKTTPTKSLLTQRDLSLGYSPGVAVPCKAIAKDPDKAYDYTSKGNYVAVISNGTAVLGLGDLGALASKPVMEGKAILFKRFADIDGIDLEVDTKDVDEFVNAVKYLGPTWGGINLEDIAAPECFIIEEKLKEVMDIPVFHDDQHGTAIITAAGLINAAHITKQKLEDLVVVVNGAGSAAIACIELIKTMGVKHEHVILCDRAGVVYEGRSEQMNQWKSKHAIKTDKRTLMDAMKGADVFLGLSAGNVVSQEMVKAMAKQPIIFAMANPDPEIKPELAKEARADAIIATGRSDYPNQVNNVMGFPYIFRGALDVHAKEINEEMKIAAAQALASLAREQIPEEVVNAYSGKQMEYGPDYIIPTPFDPRLIINLPTAVAKAAMDTGVARKPIEDFEAYKLELAARRDPTANIMNIIHKRVKANPKRIVFAEGEDEKVIQAAMQWKHDGMGEPILVGRIDKVHAAMQSIGIEKDTLEIQNAAVNKSLDKYIDYLYKRLQRSGFLYRDCVRMVKNDRNIFASCILATGEADAMITGYTRNYYVSLDNVRRVIDADDNLLFGVSMVISRSRTVFMSDTTVQDLPTSEELAQIAIRTASKARQMGHEPHVAFLSYSNFGNPFRERTERIRDAVRILDNMDVDFEYEGEMSVDIALNKELMDLYYPFSRLSDAANVLIMPGLHSANISSNILKELGGGTLIGPILKGFSKPVQIMQMNASVSDITNLAAIAAIDAIEPEEVKEQNKKAKTSAY